MGLWVSLGSLGHYRVNGMAQLRISNRVHEWALHLLSTNLFLEIELVLFSNLNLLVNPVKGWIVGA